MGGNRIQQCDKRTLLRPSGPGKLLAGIITINMARMSGFPLVVFTDHSPSSPHAVFHFNYHSSNTLFPVINNGQHRT